MILRKKEHEKTNTIRWYFPLLTIKYLSGGIYQKVCYHIEETDSKTTDKLRNIKLKQQMTKLIVWI
jgi:hypothetical protein